MDHLRHAVKVYGRDTSAARGSPVGRAFTFLSSSLCRRTLSIALNVHMFPHPTISPPGLVRKRSYPLEEDDSAVSSLWAASFQKLLGPLENLTEQWISGQSDVQEAWRTVFLKPCGLKACNQPSSPLRDETLAALSNSGGSSATRRLLLDALYSASLSMNQARITIHCYS